MNKLLRFLVIALLFSGFSVTVKAQNCSVNAGINTTICPGTPFVLTGTGSGLFNAPGSEPVWSQISGPSVTVSSTAFSAGTATATVTGYAANVPYGFRLTAKCTDGSLVYQDVIYTVSDLSTVDAGPDAYVCPGTPYTMQATALAAGETGVWTRISGSSAMPLPSPVNSPTAILNVNTSTSVQTATYRWTVSKGTCSSYSDVTLTNLGTESIDADRGDADNIISLGCYNVTAFYQLNASFAANHSASGQSGKWSFISGPSVPAFSNQNARNSTVSNLIAGTYILRWTVTGPCRSGYSDLTINVESASQDITDAGNATMVYCDGRTSVVLNGTKALYPEESVEWVKTSGPGSPVIDDPNSNITTVTGLTSTPGTNYTFTYTITNSATGCTSSGAYIVKFVQAPSVSITSSNPLLVNCGISTATITYTTAGGTDTEYALISAPSGSTLETSLGGLNNFVPAPASGATISNFDKIGTYVLRYKRYSRDGVGGCSEGYADITVITSAAPTLSNAGTKQILACNVFNTNLAGNLPAVGTGKWSQVSGPNTANIVDPQAFNTAVTGLINGTYTFRWIISGGDGNCSNSQSDVDVVVASVVPTTSAAGNIQNVCNSTPVQLDGNQPLSNEVGTWTVSPSAGVTFSNIHDPKAIATGLAPNTSYTFTWSISNSCNSSSSDVTITTSNTAGPKQALAGADQCFSSGTTSFTLVGNAPSTGETGTWTLLPGAPNSPVFNLNQYNTTVTNAVNGTYLFEWKLDRNSCSPTRDTVMITISAPATTANAGSDQNVCGTSVTLNGNAPTVGTGTWTQVGGAGGAVITDPTLRNTTVTGLTDGRYTFRWTISNNACSSNFDEVIVNVSTPPTTANAGSDQAICNATSATLAANTITVGTGIWSVVSGPSTPTFSDVHNPAATVSNLEFGVYVLRWTSTNGAFCGSSSDDVEISVTQDAFAGGDRTLCNTNTITVAGNEGSTGTWTRISGPNSPTITANGTNGAIISGMIAGTYVFRYTIDAIGLCSATSDDITVTIEAAPSAAVAGSDQALCQPTLDNTFTFTMAADPVSTGTGTWTLLDRTTGTTAPTIDDIHSPTTTISGVEPGVYLYEWRVANGSCSGASSNADIVRLTVYKEPSDAEAGPDQNNACNENVVMAATAPVVGLGTWSVVSQPGGSPTVNFVAINSPTTQVDNLVEGTYVFEWAVSNGSPICTSKTDQVQVIITSTPPTVADAGSDVDICNTSYPGTTTYILDGNAPTASETGTWTIVSQPSGSNATFSDDHANNATISGLMAGSYTLRWTIKNTANNTSTDCISPDDVVLTVYNTPTTAAAGSDQNVCQFSQVTLAATPVETNRGTGTWSVVSKPASAPDPVFADVHSATSALNGLEPGDYTLKWTTSNGNCTPSTDNVTIHVSQCEIAVAKSASTPELQTNGTYNITFTFKVKNTGNADISNVQVVDDLVATFPSPKTYTVTSVATGATSSLTVNSSFDGNSDKNLLNAASSDLDAGVEETITLVVNVKLN